MGGAVEGTAPPSAELCFGSHFTMESMPESCIKESLTRVCTLGGSAEDLHSKGLNTQTVTKALISNVVNQKNKNTLSKAFWRWAITHDFHLCAEHLL